MVHWKDTSGTVDASELRFQPGSWPATVNVNVMGYELTFERWCTTHSYINDEILYVLYFWDGPDGKHLHLKVVND